MVRQVPVSAVCPRTETLVWVLGTFQVQRGSGIDITHYCYAVEVWTHDWDDVYQDTYTGNDDRVLYSSSLSLYYCVLQVQLTLVYVSPVPALATSVPSSRCVVHLAECMDGTSVILAALRSSKPRTKTKDTVRHWDLARGDGIIPVRHTDDALQYNSHGVRISHFIPPLLNSACCP